MTPYALDELDAITEYGRRTELGAGCNALACRYFPGDGIGEACFYLRPADVDAGDDCHGVGWPAASGSCDATPRTAVASAGPKLRYSCKTPAGMYAAGGSKRAILRRSFGTYWGPVQNRPVSDRTKSLHF